MEFEIIFLILLIIFYIIFQTKSINTNEKLIRLPNIFPNNKNCLTNEKSNEDGKLITPELVLKHKYPSETHNVVTEDGYKLILHRIPKPGHQPILLLHGLLDSSAAFVIMGPNVSLGYFLYDQGYDIWLGNSRGNRYSRSHISLSPNENKFWNFSWHEIGFYDLPAMINYIRNTTSFDSLHFIGHSQGATAFFVMCSMRPEFNKKIILMQAFAPMTYMTNIKTPLIKLIDRYLKSEELKSNFEIMPQGWFDHTKCWKNYFYNIICLEIIFSIVGKDVEQFEESLLPEIFCHIPAGGSIKQIRHFVQNYHSKEFLAYDFGSQKINYKIYNQSTPFKYNLSKVSVPVILYYGQNDYLSAPEDNHKLYQKLGNIKGLYQVPSKYFNHLDFVWAVNLRKILIDNLLLKIFNDFNAGVLKYVIE